MVYVRKHFTRFREPQRRVTANVLLDSNISNGIKSSSAYIEVSAMFSEKLVNIN